MKKLFLICFTLLHGFVNSQAPSKFHTVFGGNGDDVAYACKQTLDRNYILAGSSSSSGFGQTDVYLLKVDSMGQPMWWKFIGGFGNELGKSLVELPDSGYVVAGYTSSFGAGGYDVYVVRTDKFGNTIWQKTFGGADWDFASDITLTSDGNLVIVGSTSSFGAGKKDGYVIKCDLTGNLLWQKFYGGLEDDELNGVFTKDGQLVYAAGYTKSFEDIDGDMYCIKFDTNGDSLFTLRFGSPLFDVANDVILDPSDSIILAGGMHHLSTKMEATYVKFNQSKTLFWNKKIIGLTDQDEIAAKIIYSASPIAQHYISMFTSEEISGNKKDIKIVFLDKFGGYYGGLSSGTFGFSDDEVSYDVASTKDKGYVNCGYTKSFSVGNMDILFLKRDSTLNAGNSVVGAKEEINYSDFVDVYPNPLEKGSELNVILPANYYSTEILIKLYDMSGREYHVFEGKYTSSISLSRFESGCYLLKIGSQKEPNLFYKKVLIK